MDSLAPVDESFHDAVDPGEQSRELPSLSSGDDVLEMLPESAGQPMTQQQFLIDNTMQDELEQSEPSSIVSLRPLTVPRSQESYVTLNDQELMSHSPQLIESQDHVGQQILAETNLFNAGEESSLIAVKRKPSKLQYYKCGTCWKVFVTYYHLVNHMKKHNVMLAAEKPADAEAAVTVLAPQSQRLILPDSDEEESNLLIRQEEDYPEEDEDEEELKEPIDEDDVPAVNKVGKTYEKNSIRKSFPGENSAPKVADTPGEGTADGDVKIEGNGGKVTMREEEAEDAKDESDDAELNECIKEEDNIKDEMEEMEENGIDEMEDDEMDHEDAGGASSNEVDGSHDGSQGSGNACLGMPIKKAVMTRLRAKSSTLKESEQSHGTAGDGRHHCQLCGLTFTSKIELQNHKCTAAQDVDESLTCKICSAVCASRQALHLHSLEHIRTCYLCPFCSMKFTSETSLSAHVKFHRLELKGNAMHSQPLKKVPKEEPLLDNAENVHEMYKEFECTICPFLGNNAAEWNAHMDKHYLASNTGETCKNCNHKRKVCMEIHEDVFVCLECKMKFFTQFDVEQHCQQEHSLRQKLRYPCNECDLCFSTPAALLKHESHHLENRIYKCNYCEKSFQLPNQRAMHEEIHLRGTTRHPCEVCGKTLASARILQMHMNIHTRKKLYTCKYCGLDFNAPTTLRSHLVTHTGIKAYQCKDCDKSFGTAGALKVHGRMHSQEKPYKCKHCKQGFTQLGNCRHHEYKHTGERPYKCRYCDKAFRLPTTKKKHEFIHTDSFPNKCTMCPKAFKDAYYLRQHFGVKHSLWECNLCTQIYPTSELLKQHECPGQLNVPSKVQELVDSQEVYQCAICDMTFDHMRRWKDHEKVHESDPLPDFLNKGKAAIATTTATDTTTDTTPPASPSKEGEN